MNKTILMGRLTKDVELKNTGDTSVARYTLAVNRSYKKEGQPDADFINCVAFGKSAEFAEKYFQKGQQVAVVGRLQTGNYKNKEGATVYTTDVIVEEQHFADSKKDGKTGGSVPSEGRTPAPIEDDDDIPF
jgi:single-strand DNA-binding protein